MTTLLLLPALVALAPPTPAELTALLARYGVPGAQIIYADGRRTRAYYLGVREAGTRRRVTAGTVFEAASLGKEVLAYVALRLHDQGRLDLDRPLLAYADEPRLRGEPRAARLTARMALAHTTGLPNWMQDPTAPGWDASPLRLKYAPDSCWNYSGEGYALLQRTLERLTGLPLEQLAQQEAFGPLGMGRSSFRWQPAFAARATAGHDAAGRPAPIDHFTAPNAGFSLYAPAADYQRLVRALRTGRGLRPETARLLLTPARAAARCGQPATAADAHLAWACGVGLAATSQGPAQWQWGDNGNFKNFFFTLPGRRQSLLVFTNSANGDKLTGELLRRFFGPGQYWAPQWLGLPE